MLRKILSITLLAGFVAWLAWYVRSNPGAFAPLAAVGIGDAASLTAAFVAILVCNGLFIALVCAAFEVRLRRPEYLSLSFASSFANYFLPFKGGAGMRALYLQHLHGLRFTDFVSTLGIMYLMHAVTNGLLSLCGMGIVMGSGGPDSLALLVFFALVALAGSVAMLVDLPVPPNAARFPLAQLARVLDSWKRLRRDRMLVLKLWVLMLLLTAVTVWQTRVAFDAVSVPLSWGGIMVYAGAKNLGGLIGLTPGSLGIVEVISIYLGKVLGYTTADALVIQGLIRAVSILSLLVAGPVAILLLRHRLRAARREPATLTRTVE